jgi:L-alanine-DL-glutamate epimerase-like enolase superfamily enzyme
MMHFVSSIPNSGPFHEFKEFNNELPYHCETSSLRSDEHGTIRVPSGPGLGVEIDPDFVKQCERVEA